ncbi:ribosome recycling factor [Candidatus Uhrbacteria bacterium]|nr:ribosome recycling factor [Candidatus Uhrbacteria bacterium]
MTPFVSNKKTSFQKVVDHFREELASLRSGRAQAALLDKIGVDAYGSFMPLKGIASIMTPDPKTLVIEPWDANLVRPIEQALVAADLGLTPSVQGKIIRLAMPPLTEERRREVGKMVREKMEQARVSLRAVREKIRDEIITMERDKKTSEDDRYRMQDELDKLTKQFGEEVEKLAIEKEKEIMTV